LGTPKIPQTKLSKRRDETWKAVNLSIALFFTASVAWLYSYLWQLLANILLYWKGGNPMTQSTVTAFVSGVCTFPLMITLFGLWILRVIRKNPALARLLFGPVIGVNK